MTCMHAEAGFHSSSAALADQLLCLGLNGLHLCLNIFVQPVRPIPLPWQMLFGQIVPTMLAMAACVPARAICKWLKLPSLCEGARFTMLYPSSILQSLCLACVPFGGCNPTLPTANFGSNCQAHATAPVHVYVVPSQLLLFHASFHTQFGHRHERHCDMFEWCMGPVWLMWHCSR